MAEMSNKQKQLDWICRILITANVLAIVSGYISLHLGQQQLISPLIPESTLYHILKDSNNYTMKSSLVLAFTFLTGLWFYTFKKKKSAILFFSATILLFYISPYLL